MSTYSTKELSLLKNIFLIIYVSKLSKESFKMCSKFETLLVILGTSIRMASIFTRSEPIRFFLRAFVKITFIKQYLLKLKISKMRCKMLFFSITDKTLEQIIDNLNIRLCHIYSHNVFHVEHFVS